MPLLTRTERLLRERDWPALEDAYEQLSSADQRVLDLRFGLSPAAPSALTLDELADALDVTTAEAAAVERRAVAMLGSLRRT